MTNRLDNWSQALERETDALLRPLGAPPLPDALRARTFATVRGAQRPRRGAGGWRNLLAGALAAAAALMALPGLPRELRGRSELTASTDVVLALQDWSDSLSESGRALGRNSGEDEGARPSDDEFRDLRDSLDESLNLLEDV